jgi:hypothetical protein
VTTIQLELTAPVTLSTGIHYRTQAGEATLTDYRPGHCWQQTADGQPFMETHLVYEGIEYLGQLNRAFPDTPWRIAACGVAESKTHGMDFDAAVEALIKWRRQFQEENRKLIYQIIA